MQDGGIEGGGGEIPEIHKNPVRGLEALLKCCYHRGEHGYHIMSASLDGRTGRGGWRMADGGSVTEDTAP